eukprot:1683709-Prymnesium_polylepis.2
MPISRAIRLHAVLGESASFLCATTIICPASARLSPTAFAKNGQHRRGRAAAPESTVCAPASINACAYRPSHARRGPAEGAIAQSRASTGATRGSRRPSTRGHEPPESRAAQTTRRRRKAGRRPRTVCPRRLQLTTRAWRQRQPGLARTRPAQRSWAQCRGCERSSSAGRLAERARSALQPARAPAAAGRATVVHRERATAATFDANVRERRGGVERRGARLGALRTAPRSRRVWGEPRRERPHLSPRVG